MTALQVRQQYEIYLNLLPYLDQVCGSGDAAGLYSGEHEFDSRLGQ